MLVLKLATAIKMNWLFYSMNVTNVLSTNIISTTEFYIKHNTRISFFSFLFSFLYRSTMPIVE